jgi:hypothetical protein
MNDIIKNKHVLGGLTLRDLKDAVKELRVHSVEIDNTLWERFHFGNDNLELWASSTSYEHEEPADDYYDLNFPVKVKDGKVIVVDPLDGDESTLVFGKIEFVPARLEIL